MFRIIYLETIYKATILSGTVSDPKLEQKGVEHVTKIIPKAECLQQMLTCGTVILDIGCDRGELKTALDYAKRK